MEDKIKETNLRYSITFFFHFSPEAPHPQVKLKPWRYVHLYTSGIAQALFLSLQNVLLYFSVVTHL